MGEGERCLRLGLKAERVLLRSLPWPEFAPACLSNRLEVSKEDLGGGKLERERPDCEPSWSGSLEKKSRHEREGQKQKTHVWTSGSVKSK